MWMKILPVLKIETTGYDGSMCAPVCGYLKQGGCSLFGRSLEDFGYAHGWHRTSECHTAERNYDSLTEDAQEAMEKA